MSILHGKQIAGAGPLAIAIATASIIPPTRIIPPCRIVTFPEDSSRYFLTTITPTIPAFSCGRQKYR
jgi:hypothetical protein